MKDKKYADLKPATKMGLDNKFSFLHVKTLEMYQILVITHIAMALVISMVSFTKKKYRILYILLNIYIRLHFDFEKIVSIS